MPNKDLKFSSFSSIPSAKRNAVTAQAENNLGITAFDEQVQPGTQIYAKWVKEIDRISAKPALVEEAVRNYEAALKAAEPEKAQGKRWRSHVRKENEEQPRAEHYLVHPGSFTRQ